MNCCGLADWPDTSIPHDEIDSVTVSCKSFPTQLSKKAALAIDLAADPTDTAIDEEESTMANPIMAPPTSKAELVALLKESVAHLEMTDFSPILYQTLGALHDYTGRHAGLPAAPSPAASKPFFQKSGGVNDVLASGWLDEMASSTRSSGSSSSSSNSNRPIVWKPILALLVQKDKEEPCLWITREVLSVEEGGGEPELETLHRIPMRRLQSVEYVDFYGDHRLALRIKRRENDLIFRCDDDGTAALAWVKQLESAKGKGRGRASSSNNTTQMAEVDQSVELEMDESTGDIVNLDSQEEDEDTSGDARRRAEEAKRMGDRLQESEDLRRIRKEYDDAAEIERQKAAKEETERMKQEAIENADREKRDAEIKVQRAIQEQAAAVERKNLADAAEVQRLKEQHEQAARAAMEQAVTEQKERDKQQQVQTMEKREEERRRREFELEQQKKAAAEKRRKDLAEQRRKAQEEQKKKDLEEKRKFLATEQRKLDMIARAKLGKQNSPSKASVGSSNNKSPSNASLMDKLNTQMSALDAADRVRAEEAKNKAEEEIKKETEASEDPDLARKRIAEEARQRLVQEEAEKTKEQAELLRVQQRAAAEVEAKRQQQVWAEQQRRGVQQQPYGAAQNVQQYPQPAQGQPPQQSWQAAQQQQAWNLWHQQQQQPRGPPQSQQGQYQQQQYAQQRSHSGNSVPGFYGQQPQQAHAQHTQPVAQRGYPPQQQHQPQQHPGQAATAPVYPGRTQQPQSGHHPPTGVDKKYTQMAEQAQHEEQTTSTTALKGKILLHWALQPPANQILRTIDQLLCNIHTVYPPAFGVAGHAYFKGFQAITRADISNATGGLDEEKLKKMVRKVRFFLHPDKLPRDLSEEQTFMCKLLWDVTNDSWEDHKKTAEELDWMG